MVFDRSKPDATARKLLSVDRLHALGWRVKVASREGVATAFAEFLSIGFPD